MLPWNCCLLAFAFVVAGCRTSTPVEHRAAVNRCVRADAIVLYHSGSQDKPIFPVFIGVTGRQYPPDQVSLDYPRGSVSLHLVDSTFFVVLSANMRRSVPAEPHLAEPPMEFGTFSLCLGQEQLFLSSRRDAAAFFRALLPTIVPITPAQTRLKAELETIRGRMGE